MNDPMVDRIKEKISNPPVVNFGETAKQMLTADYLYRDPQNLLDAVQAVLDRLTYKPDWKLRLVAEAKTIHRPWYLYIHLEYKVQSLDVPPVELGGSQYIRTNHDYTMSSGADKVVQTMVGLATSVLFTERSLIEMLSRGDLVNYLRGNLIMRAELHEMDEWLKLDGEHVKDPHPELPKKTNPGSMTLQMETTAGEKWKTPLDIPQYVAGTDKP